ncbi:general amidase [Moesziomyces antarcticus]|uniref:Related to AMD2 - acetamidase n=2 Tax=Pseudozyma antarctica TaxID=84753 RepID=A0A5C3FWP2_PSEA2|nr:general amidase [Moesziomyces antarcticus]GAK67246.1 general amidase [Moesziomyces antarcticus]SPO48145.1 related to AMD2 - acetamidase [Moesziomyces antarcticus]
MTTWQQVAEAKRAQREALLPAAYKVAADKLPPAGTDSVIDFARTCGVLSEREVEITETDDVSVLLARLASGHYTAVEVLEAFIKRTCVAHQLANPLTEIHFEDAREWAAELDAELKSTGKVRGPLHGLPMSVKDQFQIAGSDATIGYISYANKPSKSDSVLVDVLKRAGAVPFVKTNLPQTIMYSETSNMLWGTTVNPHNRTLHPGGSSGGEGALVAMKGSPLGVGTDVGGSVRIPATLCGVFGLRPSSHRYPYEGAINSLVGQITIPSVLGPLSRSLSGLTEFSKAVLAQQPWLQDPQTPSMPWNTERFEHARTQKKLNIGVMWHDGVVKPSPPYERAIKQVLSTLGSHDVVDFEAFRTIEMLEILGDAFCADGGKDIEAAIAPLNEPLGPCFSGIGKREATGYEVWQANKRKLAFQKAYLDHWNATAQQTKDGRPIDVLIVPGFAYTAVPPGNEIYIGYTGIFNVVDYPVVVMPVTKVDPKVDGSAERTDFLNPDDEKWYGLWDAEKLVNAPVGIQIVGRRYEEEAVLGYAEQIWNAFSASKAG